MPPEYKNSSQSAAWDLSKLPINPENVLSFLTMPFLLGVMAADSIAESLIDLGQASEEIFRGDHLPLLHLPPLNEEQETENHSK
ncbi:MAG: hypothetical protein WA865_14835 [Spirulinaceae cyanobacterium]